MSNQKNAYKGAAYYWGRLRARGETPRSWALKRGYSVHTVYSAINGRTFGPKSREILGEIEAALGGKGTNGHEETLAYA